MGERKGWVGAAIGEGNRERVRQLLRHRPGIMNREIAQELDLSVTAVGRHVQSLRREWLPSPKEP